MTTTEILVSGAGIAGCATAFWLRRYGFTPVLVERAPALRDGGQTVDLRGAGREVVDRMGLLPAACALTLPQRGIAWVDGSGRRRAQMPVEAFGGRGIISDEEILRGDLGRVLHDGLRSGDGPAVEIRYGDTITGLVPRGDEVEVHFARAAPRRFALVVGADGLGSAVRRLAHGPTAGVEQLDLVNSWFTMPAEPGLDLHGWYLMHNAAGGKVVSLRPGRTRGELKASLSVRTDDVVPGDHEGQVELLTRHFADVGWRAPQVLRALPAATDLYAYRMARVRLPQWSSGRTVLVGDAGYCPTPLTGLGTTLALVGAYVLAGELAQVGPGRAEEALASYERILRPFVDRAQDLPMGTRGYAPHGPLAIRASWLSSASATRWPARLVWERVLARAEGLDLPDYPPRPLAKCAQAGRAVR